MEKVDLKIIIMGLIAFSCPHVAILTCWQAGRLPDKQAGRQAGRSVDR